MTMQHALRLALAATILMAVILLVQAADCTGCAEQAATAHAPSNPRDLSSHRAGT